MNLFTGQLFLLVGLVSADVVAELLGAIVGGAAECVAIVAANIVDVVVVKQFVIAAA